MKIRLFTESDLFQNQQIVLTDKDHHYICNVLRCRVGQKVFLINGRDGEWESEIVSLNKRSVGLQVKKQTCEFKSLPFLGLVFVPTQKIDLLCKNATELGATLLQPVTSQFMYKMKIKPEKMRSNVREAIEQAERVDFPKIETIMQLSDFLNSLQKNDIVLFCEERTGKNRAFDVLSKLRNKGVRLSKATERVYALVGAEGGFSAQEREFINQFSNVYSINLGEQILRAETAVSSILSLAQCFLND